MKTFDEINEKYKEIGALGANYLGKWNGYDVYDGKWPEGAWVGAHTIVMIKGDEEKSPGFREGLKIREELAKRRKQNGEE